MRHFFVAFIEQTWLKGDVITIRRCRMTGNKLCDTSLGVEKDVTLLNWKLMSKEMKVCSYFFQNSGQRRSALVQDERKVVFTRNPPILFTRQSLHPLTLNTSLILASLNSSSWGNILWSQRVSGLYRMYSRMDYFYWQSENFSLYLYRFLHQRHNATLAPLNPFNEYSPNQLPNMCCKLKMRAAQLNTGKQHGFCTTYAFRTGECTKDNLMPAILFTGVMQISVAPGMFGILTSKFYSDRSNSETVSAPTQYHLDDSKTLSASAHL